MSEVEAEAACRHDAASVRLRRKIELVNGPYAESCRVLVTHPRLADLWPRFLITQHEIIRATVPLTEVAAARAEAIAADDPVASGLARYLEEHVDEELGHDDMLLEDLELLGVDRATVLGRMPSPSVASLVGAQYYWIYHHHPIAFLGFVALMEGHPPTPTLIETLISTTGYPRDAFRTFIEHGELDPGHRDRLDRTIDALPLTAEHETIMGISAMYSAALSPATIEEILEQEVAGVGAGPQVERVPFLCCPNRRIHVQRGRKSGPYTVRPVFDTLSDRLQSALGDLRGRGRLDDEAISKAMREIRLALLEADVNLQVAKDFTNSVKERATGQDVLRSLTPGQQVVKIVHEELTALMGSSDSRLAFGRPPTVILLAGLQGSGKTTAAAKLALLLRRDGKHPGLVACDLQRPAAVDQLVQLGRQIQVPVFATERADPVKAAKLGLEQARSEGLDVVILDTAGRLHVDDELMAELERVAAETKPANVLLVLDAMTGQEAVNVAVAFQERVSFDGVILTKLDGDARGGAALSVRAVTGRPVKFASVGEKLDQLEYFHPDRMASRILGMGDVLTLIEKAEAAVEEDDQAEMEKRLRAGEFTFDDFLASYRMLRKMGPLQGVLKLVPGLGKQLQGMDVDEAQLARVEAIVLSMTPQERRLPHIISMQRRRRIATGSGTSLDEVNKLMAARKQMAKMMKQMGKGKMPTLPPGALPGSR